MLELQIWLHEKNWVCNLHGFHLKVDVKTKVTVFPVVKQHKNLMIHKLSKVCYK